jgi:hypothetical protein
VVAEVPSPTGGITVQTGTMNLKLFVSKFDKTEG